MATFSPSLSNTQKKERERDVWTSQSAAWIGRVADATTPSFFSCCDCIAFVAASYIYIYILLLFATTFFCFTSRLEFPTDLTCVCVPPAIAIIPHTHAVSFLLQRLIKKFECRKGLYSIYSAFCFFFFLYLWLYWWAAFRRNKKYKGLPKFSSLYLSIWPMQQPQSVYIIMEAEFGSSEKNQNEIVGDLRHKIVVCDLKLTWFYQTF